jgi:hypothetical protein
VHGGQFFLALQVFKGKGVFRKNQSQSFCLGIITISALSSDSHRSFNYSLDIILYEFDVVFRFWVGFSAAKNSSANTEFPPTIRRFSITMILAPFSAA